MDYKEKLELAKDWYNDQSTTNKEKLLLENLFPELKESEDERIKKAIHIYLDWLDGRKDYAPKGEYSIRDMIAWLKKQGEPNWVHHKVDLSDCSEEYRKAYYDGWNNCNKQHSQLKDEQNPAWSEEDELMLTSTVNTLKLTNGAAQMKIDWLKSIKNRVQSQQKQEWSISDERILNNIFTYLGYAKDGNKYCTPELICEAENWLKSLKPQPHWKPTKEQMENLEYAINTVDKCCEDSLQSLYNDLKKL